MRYNLGTEIGAALVIAPQNITTAAVQSGAVDLNGFNTVTLAVTSGTLADGSYAVTLAKSNNADMSGSNSVAAAQLVGAWPSFAATDGGVTRRFGYIGGKRYLALTITPTGAVSGGPFSAVAVLGSPVVRPVP